MGYHSENRGGYYSDHNDTFEDLVAAISGLLIPFGITIQSRYFPYDEFPTYSVQPLESTDARPSTPTCDPAVAR